VLKIEHKTIALSEKEAKALKIFAENINETVEREKLMKEIWEDEGIVVISRNVDVLVSKLRKKISDDNSLKFINVPGRGYKFIIEQVPDKN
jgi:DNA-binding winged helix-turn-helix (wHTH) protein